MTFEVTPTDAACGAIVTGINLNEQPSDNTIAGLRAAWLAHQVLIFPEQKLDPAGLERVTQYFGPLGDDPFFEPIDDSDHVAAICRRADETAPVFAESWHTDWSFKSTPPAGTMLYGVTIPPVGGNTSFLSQSAAFAAMPASLRDRLTGLIARHSARVAYAPDGMYGEEDAKTDRSMRIRFDASAYDEHSHPLVRPHPETGTPMVYGSIGYIFAIEGMEDAVARELLLELHAWQTREAFLYHHRWAPGMLVLWDNRAVLHRANGGYDGHDRLLWRTTVADDPNYYLGAQST